MVQQQVRALSPRLSSGECSPCSFVALEQWYSKTTTLPLSQSIQRDKGQRTKEEAQQGRSGASSNTMTSRPADLTRPTADGARGRRPKITDEAALGLAGVDLWRTGNHSHRASPPASVSSSRFGEGEAACLPESIGTPPRRSHTCADLDVPRDTMTLWVKAAVGPSVSALSCLYKPTRPPRAGKLPSSHQAHLPPVLQLVSLACSICDDIVLKSSLLSCFDPSHSFTCLF